MCIKKAENKVSIFYVFMINLPYTMTLMSFSEPVTPRWHLADVSTVPYQHRRGIADFSELLQRALQVNGTYIYEALQYTKYCAMFS